MTSITSCSMKPSLENSKNFCFDLAKEILAKEIKESFWANLNYQRNSSIFTVSSETLKQVNEYIKKNPTFSYNNHNILRSELIKIVNAVFQEIFTYLKEPLFLGAEIYIELNCINLIKSIRVEASNKHKSISAYLGEKNYLDNPQWVCFDQEVFYTN